MRVLNLEKLFKRWILVEGKDYMKLIICVLFILIVIAFLSFLIIKMKNKLEILINDLESENIEQNRRFLRLEKKINQIEKDKDNEKRNNIRKNKTSNRITR